MIKKSIILLLLLPLVSMAESIIYFEDQPLHIQENIMRKQVQDYNDMGDQAYREGDYFTAKKWYLEAAELNDPDAQFSLGLMHFQGNGTNKSYHEAFNWFEKAAKQDNEKAQFVIGAMYREGRGVRQDYGKAREWYLKAAKFGVAEAYLNLGALYYEGLGVKQNRPIAIEYFGKACDLGDQDGCVEYKRLK